MEIKQWIEKAIAGGWKKWLKRTKSLGIEDDGVHFDYEDFISIEQILLDPKAWEAVGKASGWTEICNNPDHGFIDAIGGETARLGCPVCGNNEDCVVESTRYKWRDKMHQMVDALAEGKTIEEFIKTL